MKKSPDGIPIVRQIIPMGLEIPEALDELPYEPNLHL